MTACGNTYVFSSWPRTEKGCPPRQTLLSVINYYRVKNTREAASESSPKVPARRSWQAAPCKSPMVCVPHGTVTTPYSRRGPAHNSASIPSFPGLGHLQHQHRARPCLQPRLPDPPASTALRWFCPKPNAIQPSFLRHAVDGINSQVIRIFQQTRL